MSVLSNLENTYKTRLQEESDAKAEFIDAEKKYNAAVIKYDADEAEWYKIPPDGKVSLLCDADGVEYIGNAMMIGSACEYVKCKKAGGSLMACAQYSAGNMFVQTDIYKDNRDVVLRYRAAKNDMNKKEGVYEAAKELYNNARILTGKALNALNKWKIDNMTPAEQAAMEAENRPKAGRAIDVFSWKVIGVAGAILAGLFGVVWWFKNR